MHAGFRLWLSILIPLLAIIGAQAFAPPKNTFSDHHYPHLDNSSDSLRLLVLQPGKGSQAIRCTLHSTTFLEMPTYSALSYTGGSPNNTKTIIVDGRKLEVRETLWTALHHLRNAKDPQTLWVDAICINQNNIEEKNQQIPLMAFVFRRAVEVLVWLGPHKPPSDADLFKARHWIDKAKMTPHDTDWLAWEPVLYRLIHEEYWKRAWIIQEIGVASVIKVVFGCEYVPWHDFLVLVQTYQRRVPTDRAVQKILMLENMRGSRYADGETYSLSSLLNAFRDCFCSVQHDKIYAFLGIANDHLNGLIPVDYGKTIAQTYQDVISFQNESTFGVIEKRVEMVYFSGLVRRLLDRKFGTRPKEQKEFWFDPNARGWFSWFVTNMGLMGDKAEKAAQGFLALEFLQKISRWLIFFICKPTVEYTPFWHPSGPEIADNWRLEGQSQDQLDGIKVRGMTAGKIRYIGPPSSHILASLDVTKRWAAGLPGHFLGKAESKKARGRNERLMTILAQPSASRIQNIMSLESVANNTSLSPASRLFLGSDMIMGVVPGNAQVGDLICQFWNSRASAVVRRVETSWWIFWRSPDPSYQVIGRAGIVKEGHDNDWDCPTNRELFGVGSQNAIELEMDIGTLTRLSLDTVNLPYVE